MRNHPSHSYRSRRILTPLFAALLVCAGFLALGVSPANAQQYGFDPGLTGTSPGSGGSGTWMNGGTNWVLVTGTGGDVPWVNSALYGALFTTSTTVNPTVTIVGGVTASGLVFGTGSGGALYTLTGDTLTLTPVVSPGGVSITGNGAIINSDIDASSADTILISATTVILGGTNTYGAATQIQAGSTVSITNPNSLSLNSDYIVDGTLALNGNSGEIGALNGSGIVTNALTSSTAPATLTVGNLGSSGTFSGIIQDGGTGSALSLTKVGSGTLTLSGTNTYTGITTISAGAISISQDANLGTAPATVVANQLTLDGGVLETTGSFTLNSNRGITLTNNGGFIQVDSGDFLNYGGVITGTQGGDLAVDGDGTLTLTGTSNIGSGDLTVNNGTLQINSAGQFTTSQITIASSGAASVNVSGSGSLLSSTGIIIVGNGEQGSLTVQNNALVSASTTLIVGDGGPEATVTVETGGTLTALTSQIGNGATATSVTVTGSSSTFLSPTIDVGETSQGTLTVESGGLVSATTEFVVGDATPGNGTVNVDSGGTLVTGSAIMANAASTDARVTVSGSGATWTDTSSLTIGLSGSAHLTVSDTGVTSIASELIVGQDAGSRGHMTIQSSGTVTNASAILGENTGSHGVVVVEDAGSVWSSTGGGVIVGGSGTGVLTVDENATAIMTGSVGIGVYGGGAGQMFINSAGTVTDAAASIGVSALASGTVVVSDAGSTWNNNAGFVAVGGSGTGYLTVENNAQAITTGTLFVAAYGGGSGSMLVESSGTVSDGAAIIGASLGSSGTATVTGTGSVWNNGAGPVLVGGSGAGLLTVSNNANVMTTGTFAVGTYGGGSGTMLIESSGTVTDAKGYIGAFPGSTGNVTVTGASSTWNNTDKLVVGGTGSGPGGIGVLTIQNGGVVNALLTTIWSGGTLQIGSSYTLTGGVSFDGGTLRALANTTFVNSATIGPVGVAVDTNGFNMPQTGVLSGPGGLIKVGNGNLIMNGVNTYAAGTNLAAGGIGLGSNATSTGGPIGTGALNVTAATGNLFASGADRTLPNAISIGGGSILDIIDDPTGGGAHNLKITGPINGAGGLTMDSSQSLTLNGPNNYTGNTVIDSGIVVVNGPKALGNGNVFLHGGELTADPQPINVRKNYTQDGGATLLLHVDGVNPGQFDYLNVTGHASLNGTLILLNPNNIFLTVGQQLPVVLAKNGITGRFSNVDFDGLIPQTPLLMPEIMYNTHDVIVGAAQGSFVPAAKTPNELAVAQALSRIPYDSEAVRVLDFLDFHPRNLTQELNDIAPAGLSSIYEISFATANTQQNNLENRMDDIRAGATGFNNSLSVSNSEITKGYDGKNVIDTKGDYKNPYTPPQIPSGGRLGVFISGNGNFVDVGHDPNARGYDFDTGGVTIGIDYRVTNNFAVGVALGYANTEGSLDGAGSIGVNSAKGGVYATLFDNNSGFYFDTYAGGGFNSYDTRRSALLKDATGATNGGEFNSFISGGYDMKAGGLVFGPVAALDYSYVEFNQFTERGSVAPLKILNQNQDSFRSEVGVKLAYPVKTGGISITPQLRASWQHEFAYGAMPIDAEFNDTNDLFRVYGPKIGRDSALLEAGVRVQWTPMIATFLNYDGKINPSYEANSVNGGLDLTF